MYVRFIPIGYGEDQQKPYRSRFTIMQNESAATIPALAAAVRNIKNAVCIDTVAAYARIRNFDESQTFFNHPDNAAPIPALPPDVASRHCKVVSTWGRWQDAIAPAK